MRVGIRPVIDRTVSGNGEDLARRTYSKECQGEVDDR
jgi:hypothetical protein